MQGGTSQLASAGPPEQVSGGPASLRELVPPCQRKRNLTTVSFTPYFIVPLKTMNTNVLCAVFKRNFVNYFANPTGYVFICVFLLLSSCAAFRPSEFFTANLCNLDALNGAITLILLFFVPAITMGVWADESRQGTDELLLTIPAGDLEIVLGKYLACRRHLHGGAGLLGGLQLPRPPPTRRARTWGSSFPTISATGSWDWRCCRSAWWPRSSRGTSPWPISLARG